jgi:hypothetical protein
LLRAVGIPAHPVTADASLETGQANWTFDTWVEFLAEYNGSMEWRIFHPHEYPGMLPESRGVFGRRGVASKGFNDLIIMANATWVEGALDDGAVNVAYGRNACGEPQQVVDKAPWVDELCESGYWTQPHWECPEGAMTRVAAAKAIRLEGGALEFGGRLAGAVHLQNPMADRYFGRLVLELDVCRMESKSFVEKVLFSAEFPVTMDPDGALMLPFDCALPATLAPGRELCLRALFSERTVLIMPLRMPSPLAGQLDMPALWHEGVTHSIRLRLRNTGAFTLQAVDISVDAPYALRLQGPGQARFDALAPGEEREAAFDVRAVAELSSGSLHVAVGSANGGALMLRRPFRVELSAGLPSSLRAGRPAAAD